MQSRSPGVNGARTLLSSGRAFPRAFLVLDAFNKRVRQNVVSAVKQNAYIISGALATKASTNTNIHQYKARYLGAV